jgi:hypothetical protein
MATYLSTLFPALVHRATTPCPFPHRRQRHARSLPAPLTCVAVTCIARSLAVSLSPIAVGHAADPAMDAGAHVTLRLRSSSPKLRAPTSVAGAGGARAPRLAVNSHLVGRNRPAPRFPPMLHMYVLSVSDVSDVCCNYFVLMLQK